MHGTLTVCMVLLRYARYTYSMHGILTVCTVHLQYAWYTYGMHGTLTVCTVHSQYAWYTYGMHGTLTVCTVHLRYARCTYGMHGTLTVMVGRIICLSAVFIYSYKSIYSVHMQFRPTPRMQGILPSNSLQRPHKYPAKVRRLQRNGS